MVMDCALESRQSTTNSEAKSTELLDMLQTACCVDVANCMCCYHGSVHQIVLESVSVSVLPSATGAEDGILAPRHLITHRARSKAVARGV